jgi:hypothetical protein
MDRAAARKAVVEPASVGFVVVIVLGFMVLGHGGSGTMELGLNCVDLKSWVSVLVVWICSW